MADLTPKQQRFVAEYLVDLNATKAAARAGYTAATARQQGSRLLTNVDIANAVADGAAQRLAKSGLTADRTLEEMRRLAFSDIRKFFTDWGGLKPIHELSDEEASVVASFEVIKKNLFAGDKKVDTIHKLKAWDKLKALEMLAKHFGLLVERIDQNVTLEINVKAPWRDQSGP